MRVSQRFMLLLGGLAATLPLSASAGLSVLRSGVGVTGRPIQLAGNLDSDHNGRRELLVAGRWHFSIVEEDASPRGYREIARVDAPDYRQFEGALLVDMPGAATAVLVQWSDRLELLDTVTWRAKAGIYGTYGQPLLGDVDGDGLAEIVLRGGGTIELRDPATLALRASAELYIGWTALADIAGDARAELISSDGRAYTLTRNGSDLSAAEVWQSGLTGTWIPYAITLDSQPALVLHDSFGFSAQLATFRPDAPLRTLVPADGPSFQPRFADVNGDGRTDAIVATTGEIRALDITSGATLWQRDTIYRLPYLGSVYSPVTADLDSDGVPEMAWADTSYQGGIVAVSVPPTGGPRWRTDKNQSSAADWTPLRRADGSTALAYLTYATDSGPRLATLGFLDGRTLADQGGSTLTWLPGYPGNGNIIRQNALTALPQEGQADAVIVVGAEEPMFGGDPLARWLWTFDDRGELQSARTFTSTLNPLRITAAQVLARPERQLVVAGWLPLPTSGPPVRSARVEVIDYASGSVLWQSAPLPSYEGAPVTRLAVADVNGDGQRDIVVAYGQNVAVLSPAAGTSPVATHVADNFSVLDRGPGRNAWLATLFNTLDDTTIAVYDGIATAPLKTFDLESLLERPGFGIALFAQPPGDSVMLATTGYGGLTVRRYDDSTVVAESRPQASIGSNSLTALDIDGDQRIDIIGADPGFTAWRLDNDYLFRDGFD